MKVNLFVTILVLHTFFSDESLYTIGTGKYDITGPTAQIGMMGFGMTNQTTAGILSRMWARAYIIVDSKGNKVCYVNIDTCGTFASYKISVVERLQKDHPDLGITEDNLTIAAIHNHSGPGGSAWRLLYNFTIFGYDQDGLDVIVDGVVAAIVAASKDMKANSRIYINTGDLPDGHISRSPESYMNNPEKERSEYSNNLDDLMTVLKFTDENDKPFGMINFYAVHAHTIENTNHLIASDNKGYAQYVFEREMKKRGIDNFVASFSNSNEGDASSHLAGGCCDWKYADGKYSCPNEPFKQIGLHGYRCTGQIGDCNNNPKDCIAHGSGSCDPSDSHCRPDYESAKDSGMQQVDLSLKLFDAATVRVSGLVAFNHRYLDLANKKIDPSDLPCTGEDREWCETQLNVFYDEAKQQLYLKDDKGSHYFPNNTCTAAAGYSFGAGTTDGVGPSMAVLTQGNKSTNPFFELVTKVLTNPSQADVDCHYPKPILLFFGKNDSDTKSCVDYLSTVSCASWTAVAIPIQILQIGQVVIPAVPSEWTTMLGHRLRKVLKKTYSDPKYYFPIAGLSNAYIDYVTTFEEYLKQRYEGGSTLFGPFESVALLSEFDKLTKDLHAGVASKNDMEPADITKDMISTFLPIQGIDVCPWNNCENHGKVSQDVNKSYKVGERVVATFTGGNPRVNFKKMNSKSYLYIQKKDSKGNWVNVRDDNDWDTTYSWSRSKTQVSSIEVTWKPIKGEVEAGTYRIYINGWAAPYLFDIHNYRYYEGYSGTFQLTI